MTKGVGVASTRTYAAEPWDALDVPHSLDTTEVVVRLESSDHGLSADEAARRLAAIGPNALPESAPRAAWRRLLAHFHNILIYILLASALVKAAYGDWVDVGVIATVAIATALIGFVQEGQAERALAGIRRMLSTRASVSRDGDWIEVAADALVPGDVIRLRPGDRIPADARVLEVHAIEIDESALTGESLAVEKSAASNPADTPLGDRSAMVHSGTLATRGTAVALVTATGASTQLGRIQTLIAAAPPLTTPLTRSLTKLSTILAVVILVTTALMSVFAMVVHGQSLKSVLDAAITFAVAAVPEGLPAVVTITLAIGVQQMAARRAITRTLTAVETLGEVTIICSDKTGTLTHNAMTVREIVTAQDSYRITGDGYDPHGDASSSTGDVPATLATATDLAALVEAMVLASDATLQHADGAWRIDGAPTEGALVVLGAKLGLERRGERRAELPFDSARKLMAVVHETSDGAHLIAKGAPDRLLDRCVDECGPGGAIAPLDRGRWDRVVLALGERGLRVLAVASARRDIASIADGDVAQLTMLGLVGIADPPRREAADAIARCHAAGIQVTMITGDHAATAGSIAEELGISHGRRARVVTGVEVENMGDADLEEIVCEVDVFARTSPEHKLRIVRALQSRNHVVAMTGDGVNDAPALRRADIGIAMGVAGTEATKEAADIVLADDDFATIERAVAEGRRIFDNVQKSLMFILPTTFAQALIVLVAVIGGFEPPLQPTQVLWVNLITAITLSIALAYEPAERNVMERPPRAPHANVIQRALLPRIVWTTSLITTASIGAYTVELALGAARVEAQTVAITVLVLAQVAYLFSSRFLHRTSISVDVLRGNRAVPIAIGVLAVLQLAYTYVPVMQDLFHVVALSARGWLIAAGAAVCIFLLVEAEKAIARRVR